MLLSKIVGTARHLAASSEFADEATAEIRRTALDRDDFLTEAAGLGVGAWSVHPTMPVDLFAAGLLANSIYRIDLGLLTRWITVGQERGVSEFRDRP